MGLENFIECFENVNYFVLSEDKKEIVYPDTSTNKGRDMLCKFTLLEKKDNNTFYNPYTKQVYECNERQIEKDGKVYTVIQLLEVTKYKNLVNEYVLDETTGLLLRKKLLKSLNEYLQYAVENKESFSLTMLDIDFFKKINDTYGHQFGDLALNDLARVLNDKVNINEDKKGIIGRYGGEEFIFTINNTDFDYAIERNEYIREFIAYEMEYVDSQKVDLTCSLGTTFVDYEEIKNLDIEDMHAVRGQIDSIITVADKNLYESKKAGRNTLTITQYVKKNSNH